MNDDTSGNDLTELTVELLSAYVVKNSVHSEDLPSLIALTHAALSGLDASGQGKPEPAERRQPPVTSRKSLTNRDFIVSRIDGKQYKSLKPHLNSHALTPDEYRTRYNLRADYPMVSPGYSDVRREVAKRLNLGRKPRNVEAAEGANPAGTPWR